MRTYDSGCRNIKLRNHFLNIQPRAGIRKRKQWKHLILKISLVRILCSQGCMYLPASTCNATNSGSSFQMPETMGHIFFETTTFHTLPLLNEASSCILMQKYLVYLQKSLQSFRISIHFLIPKFTVFSKNKSNLVIVISYKTKKKHIM